MTSRQELSEPRRGHSPIRRHKTAIRRADFSLPIKCLLRDGLAQVTTSLFDYGCGHGHDVRLLRGRGITCSGWDPVLLADATIAPADVVNLGYVINVIEDASERAATLQRAWQLAQKLLVVSAQIQVSGRGKSQVEFGDGVLTRIGTFQKFYRQGELKEYLEQQLGVEAIPAALGTFYLFRDQTLEQQFLASRYRRRPATPRKRIAELRFEEHRGLLEPLMGVVAELGRVPEADELPEAPGLIATFGSLKRAFALVRRVTGDEEWQAIRTRKIEDLIVYLALAKFRRRPAISKLPVALQRDIREFFGTYKRACEQADELLFKAGAAEAIDGACRGSPIGKLLPNALYVHRSALDCLEPLLRIYEGCARAYLGEIEDATLVKLHRFSGKVSYLAYPQFETDPHPALVRSVKLSLRSRELDCWDYADSDNPPVLHRKETFLEPDHPLHSKFARLTAQEERLGLLDDTATIGTRSGWLARLAERGVTLRGHRVVRCNRLE